MKWNLRAVYHASRDVNRLERHIQPDVVYHFSFYFGLYNGQAPCVFNTDTTFLGWQESWPEFGNLALCMQVLEERIAVRKSAYIITSANGVDRKLFKGIPSIQTKLKRFLCLQPYQFSPCLMRRRLRYYSIKNHNYPLRLLTVGGTTNEKVLIYPF